MVRPVSSLDEVVEEIMRLHRNLQPRPSVEEVEAAVVLVRNVDATKSGRLQTLKRQAAPPGAPEELFAVLQEMRRSQIEAQAEEEKREAVALLQLEDRHRFFDYLVQRASTAVPSSSSTSSSSFPPEGPPVYLLGAPSSSFGVANCGVGADYGAKAEGEDSKYSRDDSFVHRSKIGIPDGHSEGVAPRNRRSNLGLAPLEERPSTFGRLSADTNVKGELKLSLVKLASLIETMAKEAAEKLDLQERLIDQVEWLPDSIGKLSNLTEMDLSDNKIVTLPSSIQGLSRLRTLDLHANKLVDLPDTIVELSNLTKLDVRGNRLQKLPASIGNLSRLECLDLSLNQLSSLPESVGHLINLKILNIESNEIEELPYTIGQCASLTELRADFNHLKALPEALGKIESLQVLTLHYNNIKSLPTTMGSLLNLRELDLSFNELESIPESLCLATSLVKLNVSNNFADLQRLPRSIGNLEMLEELDISNDQIKFLPDSFAKLTSLRVLNAEETPLEIPPRTVVQRGAKAVVEFMIEYVTKKNESVPEVKPKWTWSKFCPCLRKRKREDRNSHYVRAGA